MSGSNKQGANCILLWFPLQLKLPSQTGEFHSDKTLLTTVTIQFLIMTIFVGVLLVAIKHQPDGKLSYPYFHFCLDLWNLYILYLICPVGPSSLCVIHELMS